MTDIRATLLARLSAAVGSTQVLTDPADLAPYLTDWRGRYHGRAAAVVRPANTAEVAAVVAACAEAGAPIVPQGGNTGQCGGATPDERGTAVVVSLQRMNRIRAVDADNATLTADAGAPLARVQEAAAQAGLMFPLSLAAEGSCTIGGNLSTNAGGTAVLRYGNARDLTLGIEAVLSDGRVWDGLRGLRKDNTGYDLKQLFIGAEGTLGIITAAVLKLFPAARSRSTALVAVADVAAAVRLLRAFGEAVGERLVGFELMSAYSLALSRKHHPGLPDPLPGHPWYVLAQVDDSRADAPVEAELETALAALIEDGRALDATLAQSGEQARALWALREGIAEAQRREGPNIKHDISVPVSAIPRFLDTAAAALDGCAAWRALRHLRAPRRWQSPLQSRGTRRGGCRVVHGQRPARVQDRARPGRGSGRKHQRGARNRPVQAGRARAVQERGGARADAGHQGGARSRGHPQSRQGSLTGDSRPWAK